MGLSSTLALLLFPVGWLIKGSYQNGISSPVFLCIQLCRGDVRITLSFSPTKLWHVVLKKIFSSMLSDLTKCLVNSLVSESCCLEANRAGDQWGHALLLFCLAISRVWLGLFSHWRFYIYIFFFRTRVVMETEHDDESKGGIEMQMDATQNSEVFVCEQIRVRGFTWTVDLC